MTAEWRDYLLMSVDCKLINTFSSKHPKRAFRVLEKHLFQKSSNSQILDFGIFDKIKDPLHFSPGLQAPFDEGLIYKILTESDVSFRIRPIFSINKHDIARTIKPGIAVCVTRGRDLFGVFQGFTTRRFYAIWFYGIHSMMFKPLSETYTIKELRKILDELEYATAVNYVHES